MLREPNYGGLSILGGTWKRREFPEDSLDRGVAFFLIPCIRFIFSSILKNIRM